MRGFSLALVSLAILAVPRASEAHEVRPGYLELRQTAEESYEVLWKVPARGQLRLGIYPRLPERCDALAPVATYPAVPPTSIAGR